MRLTSSQKMATHSSILAWKIPRTEEPDGLYSPWGCKTDMTERTHMGTHTRGAVEEIRKGFREEVETEQHLRGQGGSGYAGLEEKCLWLGEQHENLSQGAHRKESSWEGLLNC